jgi:hypothetical protein
VDGQLIPGCVHPLDHGGQFLSVNGWITAISRATVLRLDVVGLAEIARVALDGTVREALDRADGDPVLIRRHRHVDFVIQHQHGHLDHGPDLHPDGQAACLEGRERLRHGLGPGGTRLGRRHANRRVASSRRLDGVHHVRLAESRHQAADLAHGRALLHDPIRLPGGVAAETPAGGIRRLPGNPRQLKCQRVGHAQVTGDVANQNGMLGADAVKILAGGMAPFCQKRVVVTPPSDPFPGWCPCGPLLQPRQQISEVPDRADRRAVEVYKMPLQQARTGKMPMGVDETRQHGRALKIEHASIRVRRRGNLRASAHRKNTLAPHRHRARHRIGGVQGDDRAAVIHHVRCRRGLRTSQAKQHESGAYCEHGSATGIQRSAGDVSQPGNAAE